MLAGPRLAMACPIEVRGADAARWQAVALEAGGKALPKEAVPALVPDLAVVGVV